MCSFCGDRQSASSGATEHADTNSVYVPQHPTLLRADTMNMLAPSAIAYFDSLVVVLKNDAEAVADDHRYALVKAAQSRLAQNLPTEARALLNDHEADFSHTSNEPLKAQWHYTLGCACEKMQDNDSAIIHFDKAIAIFTTLQPVREELIKSHRYIGEIYRYHQYDYQKALHHFERMLQLLDESHTRDNYQLQYLAHYNLTNTHRELKNLEKALHYGKATLRIAEQMEQDIYTIYIAVSIANIYESKREYDKALEAYRSILLNPSIREYGMFYIICLDNYAIIQSKSGNYASAIQLHNEALAAMKKSKSDPKLEADIYGNLGLAYRKNGNYAEAERSLFTCLRLRQALYPENHDANITAYVYLAEFYMKSSQYRKALAYYQKALDLMRTGEDAYSPANPPTALLPKNYQTYQTLSNKGIVLYNLALRGDSTGYFLQQAIDSFLSADTLVSKQRARSGVMETDELWMANEVQAYSDSAMKCLLKYQQLHPDRDLSKVAYRFIEHNKVQILQKAIAEARQLGGLGLPDSIIAQSRSLKARLAHWQLQSSKSREDSVLRDREIFKIVQAQDRLRAKIEAKLPMTLQSDSAMLDLAEFQQLLNKTPGRMLVGYFEGSEHITALALSSTHTTLYSVEKDSLYMQALHDFRQALSDPNPYDSSQFSTFQAASLLLYNKLLKPALNNISEYDALCIIPDGHLAQIPFEALLYEAETVKKIDYKQLPYLAKAVDVHYQYSFEFFKQSETNPQKTAKKLAAWGYDEHPAKSLSRLGGAAKELQSLREYFSTDTYQNERATESAFKDNAANYDVLHLSVHGIAHADTLKNPALFFYPDADNDGVMQPYDLYNLPLQTALVTLSACETGLGTLAPGEGVYSLSRGFFYAGSTSVIMSLWKLNDQATVALMRTFYGQLRKQRPLDECLRTAKLQYIAKADGYTAHPAYWASLVLMGDRDTIAVEGHYKWRFLLMSAAALVAITALLFLWTSNHRRKSGRAPKW
jgi:CHAT domain-containing protein/Flp pilus assembly protein TadD